MRRHITRVGDHEVSNPLAKAAVSGAAAVSAGGVAAVVLLVVGLSLVLAGLVVLATMLAAGLTAPLAVMRRRRRKPGSPAHHPKDVIAGEATVRPVGRGHAPEALASGEEKMQERSDPLSGS